MPKIRQERPTLKKENIPFHEDNARVHTSVLTMKKLNELRYKFLKNPGYPQDLFPSNYYIFSSFKNSLLESILYQMTKVLQPYMDILHASGITV